MAKNKESKKGKKKLTEEEKEAERLERKLKIKNHKKHLRYYIKVLTRRKKEKAEDFLRRPVLREKYSHQYLRELIDFSKLYADVSRSMADLNETVFNFDREVINVEDYVPPSLTDLAKPLDIKINDSPEADQIEGDSVNSGEKQINNENYGDVTKQKSEPFKKEEIKTKESNKDIEKSPSQKLRYEKRSRLLCYQMISLLCFALIIILIFERAIGFLSCPALENNTANCPQSRISSRLYPKEYFHVQPQFLYDNFNADLFRMGDKNKQLFFTTWHILNEIDGVPLIYLNPDDVDVIPKLERALYINKTMTETLVKFGFDVKSVTIDLKYPPRGESYGTNVFASVYIDYVQSIRILRGFGFPDKFEKKRVPFEKCFFDELHNYLAKTYLWTSSQFIFAQVDRGLYQAMLKYLNISAKRLPAIVPTQLQTCKDNIVI